MVSLFEYITCSSLLSTLEEIKLIVIVNWIFDVFDFLRLFMVPFNMVYFYQDILQLIIFYFYHHYFILNIVITSNTIYIYWFIIIFYFFLILQKILNIFFSILNIYTVTWNQQSPGIYKYWYAWEKSNSTKKLKKSSNITHVVKIK